MRRASLLGLAGAAFLFACSDGADQLTPPNPDFSHLSGTIASSNNFQQCQNGNPRSAQAACSWTNSNLNATHNEYYEGEIIPWRLVMSQMSTAPSGQGTHMLEMFFQSQKTQSGNTNKTYDFMATYFLTEGVGKVNVCSDGNLAMMQPFCTGTALKAGLTATTFDLSAATAQHTASVLAAQNAFDGVAGNSRLIHMWGGTITSVQITEAAETGSGGAVYDRVVIRFNASSADVLVAFGGHLARIQDYQPAMGGSANVSGSPFHVRLDKLNTHSVGNKAINVQGAVVRLPEPRAKISIALDGTNEVGDPHTVTGKVEIEPDVGLGFQNAPNGTVINFAITSGPGSLTASSCTVSDGSGSCSVALNSSAPGVTVVSASSTIQVEGQTFNLSTNGSNGSSGPLTKTWVDAFITVSPLTDTNPIGQAHEITATVKQYNGSTTATNAPDGTTVTFSLLNNSAGAAFVGGVNTCTTTNGTCSVFINSSSVGSVDIHATTTFSVGGVSLTRETDGQGQNSGDANKVYAAARISIAADAVNVVGDPHTFTVTVERDNGSGFVGVDNQVVTATKTGAGSFVGTAGCTTNSSGVCTIEVTSSTTGVMSVTASANVLINGHAVAVSTDGVGGNDDPGVKRWVQARLLLTPATGENLLGEPHPLTATLEFDYGDGSGFVGAGAGETIGMAILSGPGSLSAASCVTLANSSCSLTLTNASTSGTTTVQASWSGSITAAEGTVSASAQTGTSPSDANATKDWVLGSISVTKNIVFGPFTTSAQVCLTLSRTDGPLSTTSTNPQCQTITAPATSAVFSWAGLVAGTYTITENSVDAPYVVDDPITGIVVDDDNRSVNAGSLDNPLPKGALVIAKQVNGSTSLGSHEFSFKVERCGSGSTASQCNSPVEISGSPFALTAANNPRTIGNLDEGYYQVTEINVIGFQVLPAISQIVQVVAGNTANPPTVTFDNVFVGDVCEDPNDPRKTIKPKTLVMLYNRNGTLNDNHNQASGEVIISVLDIVEPNLRPGPVKIRMYDHQDKQLGQTVEVAAGQNAELRFEYSGNKLVPSRAGFRVFPGNATVGQMNNLQGMLEHVQFHSSCSQPLAPGNEFGSFLLLRGEN